jgi:hypothetical protein
MMLEIIANRKIIYSDSEGVSREWDSDFDIRDAKYYPGEDLLAMIIQRDGDSQYLKGVNPDGTLRFEVNPPKDYFFIIFLLMLGIM